MKIESLCLPDVKLITSSKFEDNRGHFVENFRQDQFDAAIGSSIAFVQENYSFSKDPFTVRGMHAQNAPHAQGKLVRCVRGKIRDAVVDVRPGSSSYGRSVMVDLSASEPTMVWVPKGFLHGFVTLEADTEVSYKCTNYYAPDFAINVDWQDGDLNLDWQIDPKRVVISDKDKNAQSFHEYSQIVRGMADTSQVSGSWD